MMFLLRLLFIVLGTFITEMILLRYTRAGCWFGLHRRQMRYSFRDRCLYGQCHKCHRLWVDMDTAMIYRDPQWKEVRQNE